MVLCWGTATHSDFTTVVARLRSGTLRLKDLEWLQEAFASCKGTVNLRNHCARLWLRETAQQAAAAAASSSSSSGLSPDLRSAVDSACNDALRLCSADYDAIRACLAPTAHKWVGLLGSGSYGVVIMVRGPGATSCQALKLFRRVEDSDVTMENELLHLRRGTRDSASFLQRSSGTLPLGTDAGFHGVGALLGTPAIGNLRELARRSETSWTPLSRAFIVRQMMEAVIELHRMGVAHRDLKLDNLLGYPRRNGLLHVKLTDFGTAAASNVVAQYGSGGHPGNVTTALVCDPAMVGTSDANFYETDPAAEDMWGLGVAIVELAMRGKWWLWECVHADAPEVLRVVAKKIGPPPAGFRNFAGLEVVVAAAAGTDDDGRDDDESDDESDDWKRVVDARLGPAARTFVTRHLLQWVPAMRLTVSQMSQRINGGPPLSDASARQARLMAFFGAEEAHATTPAKSKRRDRVRASTRERKRKILFSPVANKQQRF